MALLARGSRALACCVTGAVALTLWLAAAQAHASSIWTPLSSGTTDTISAIDYQSPTRLWYATTNGRLAYFDGSAFTAGTGPSAGTQFDDIAFGPGTSTYGYAVSSDGQVWRSSDSGQSWTKLASLSTLADCSSGAATVNVTELNAVVWASASTAYVLGNNGTVEKSTNANTGSPAFTEINKNGSGACQDTGDSSASAHNFTDGVFLPGNPLNGYLIQQSFGRLFSSSNGFTSGVSVQDTVNSYAGNPRIAQDPGNPNRLWAVDHDSGGAGCGELCLIYSTDGGQTNAHATFPNDSNPTVGLFDVAFAGGSVLTAGTSGEIFNSVDGSNFYNQPAGGSLTTENWRAVGAYDAQHAVVGGAAGALVITAQANTIPDIVAPTGSISGPTTVTAGTPATYTANVSDNSGGSGVDPNGYTWTAPGFAPQHGSSASFDFPRGTGSATITLSFRDNAGNTGTSTLNVIVNDPVPSIAPTITPSAIVGGGSASVSGSTITISLGCVGSAPCPITITITFGSGSSGAAAMSARAKPHKKAAKTVVLATGQVTIPAKTTRKLSLTLTSAGRRLLAKHHGHLSATLRVVNAGRVTSRTISITTVKHKAARHGH